MQCAVEGGVSGSSAERMIRPVSTYRYYKSLDTMRSHSRRFEAVAVAAVHHPGGTFARRIETAPARPARKGTWKGLKVSV